MSDINSSKAITIARWIARILGTLLVAFFLFFFIADIIEAGSKFLSNTSFFRILMGIFFFLSVSGNIIAWRWEGIGGVLALVGIIVFGIIGMVHAMKLLVVVLIYAIPALLFLFCWWRTRKLKAKRGFA